MALEHKQAFCRKSGQAHLSGMMVLSFLHRHGHCYRPGRFQMYDMEHTEWALKRSKTR